MSRVSPAPEPATAPYPPVVTYEDFLAIARRFEGQALETVTGRKFRVGIYLECPFYTPESTGRGQSDGRAAAERFVQHFSRTGSLRPGDYAHITRNASYHIGLLAAGAGRTTQPRVT
jgi:hypothetical protein